MTAREFDFSAVVGPTHNYAGLSPGNLASEKYGGAVSNPRAAALQSLSRMATLHSLGVPGVVLPPQPRPAVDWLRRLGFAGSDTSVVAAAARDSPRLLSAAYSASSMWVANAATVSPSADSADGKLHLTTANLRSEPHRSLEVPFTAAALRAVLPDRDRVVQHEAVTSFGDEGAANHTRLCSTYGAAGFQVFMFGTETPEVSGPQVHPARQHEVASRAVARLHDIPAERRCFLQQAPAAIDRGVFHNDVIATGDRDLLFFHESAFADPGAVDRIADGFDRVCDASLRVVQVPSRKLSLGDAVRSYLFNCQLVRAPDGGRVWIGPEECRDHPAIQSLLEELVADRTLSAVHFVDLRESMHNGGGPACLRLRVVLTEEEANGVHPGARFDPALQQALTGCIERHYRDRLAPADLADPALIDESRAALEALTQVLALGSVYDFQQV